MKLIMPLKVLPQGDSLTLLAWRGHNSDSIDAREINSATKTFIAELRNQFPHLATEFVWLHTRHGVRRSHQLIPVATIVKCDYHFVAYGVKPNELMLLRLAHDIQIRDARLRQPDEPQYQPGWKTENGRSVYRINRTQLEPSQDLVERMARRAARKVR